jgi:hypothetical protein
MKPNYLGKATTMLIAGSATIAMTALVTMFFLDGKADSGLIALNWVYLTIAAVTGTWLHSRRAEALAVFQGPATSDEEIQAYYE